MGTTTRSITIPSQVNPTAVLGPVDEVLRQVENGYPDLTIVVRGNRIAIKSHSADSEANALDAESFFSELVAAAASGSPFDADTVRRLMEERGRSQDDFAAQRAGDGNAGNADAGSGSEFAAPVRMKKRVNKAVKAVRAAQKSAAAPIAPTGAARIARLGTTLRQEQRSRVSAESIMDESQGRMPRVITFALGVPVRPKTPGQIDYVNTIDRNVITFGIGPAGTGKTYLAVAKAVQAFESKQVRRIILTRPAVEAGENLGFLPGSLSEKIDPYLRPLYDALSDMLGSEQLRKYMADNTIEVAPLAYMRGRTLNDAFVILDEAQNTTEQQMKMFLTRLGFNTTMVVTGDATQVDLGVSRSGLRSIESILGTIDTIKFVHLGADDVVRHSLVGKIVQAYEEHEEKKERRA